MNPQEFEWQHDQQVTVSNPTKDNFQFQVGGKDYEVKAGKSVKMPGFIAWNYVYHQASQLAQADGVGTLWNEPTTREEYYEKLVVGIDPSVQDVQEEVELEEVGEDKKAKSGK